MLLGMCGQKNHAFSTSTRIEISTVPGNGHVAILSIMSYQSFFIDTHSSQYFLLCFELIFSLFIGLLLY